MNVFKLPERKSMVMHSQTPEDDSATDSAIIHTVLSGNRNAYEQLLTKYKHHVFRVVGKHVPRDQVSDVAHDVFIRAYRSLSRFSFKSSFKTWLSGIAIKTCYDFWRKRYRSQEIPLSTLTERHKEWLDAVSAAESAAIFNGKEKQNEAREILDWALHKISAEERMVIELVYFEGYSVKETAQLLEWTSANVKIKAFRARQKLKKVLKNIMDT